MSEFVQESSVDRIAVVTSFIAVGIGGGSVTEVHCRGTRQLLKRIHPPEENFDLIGIKLTSKLLVLTYSSYWEHGDPDGFRNQWLAFV